MLDIGYEYCLIAIESVPQSYRCMSRFLYKDEEIFVIVVNWVMMLYEGYKGSTF